jgi:pseudaminic acid synthase
VVENIKAGEVFTEKNIRSIRPGYGLHPEYYEEVLRKRAKVDLERGMALKWDHVSKRQKPANFTR